MKYDKELVFEVYSGWFKKLQASGKNYNDFILILIRASRVYFGIKEEWKDIPEYEGFYQISSFGRARSIARVVDRKINNDFVIKERILSPYYGRYGYLMITLSKAGIQKTKLMHQLVAIMYLGHKPCGHKLVVDHRDFIRNNNWQKNLRIINQRENTNRKHLQSTSKYTGVCWNKNVKKWQAMIYVDGKLKHLGLFKLEYDASVAYENKLKEIIFL